MDINQLKLILESVKDVSELSAAVALSWVVISQLGPLLLGAYGIYTVSRILNRFVLQPFADTRTLIGIRDAMMPREAGTPIVDGERRRVVSRLSDLRDAGLLGPELPDLSPLLSSKSAP